MKPSPLQPGFPPYAWEVSRCDRSRSCLCAAVPKAHAPALTDAFELDSCGVGCMSWVLRYSDIFDAFAALQSGMIRGPELAWMMCMRARACCGMLSLAALLAAAACSSSPASPAVPTVAPQQLTPANGAQIANQAQPVTLVVQNAVASKAGTT